MMHLNYFEGMKNFYMRGPLVPVMVMEMMADENDAMNSDGDGD